jgi:hypothetical protein
METYYGPIQSISYYQELIIGDVFQCYRDIYPTACEWSLAVMASKQLHSRFFSDGSISLDLFLARVAAKMNP